MFKIVKKFYKGFTTKNYEGRGGSFDIYNVECVQQDILNEIFTTRGERLMMPEFGTRIPLLVFEPNDEDTHQVIREDLDQVFKNDPRVELQNLDILPKEDLGVLIVVCKVKYLEFDVIEDLRIEISSN